jgi:starvation-inducible DNA-binding protein
MESAWRDRPRFQTVIETTEEQIMSATSSPSVTAEISRVRTLSPFNEQAVRDISASLKGVLADAFALYVKTKNFHWHVSGPHFRDYHLLFDEQGTQIFAMTDPIAERGRKIGGTTLRSVGDITRFQTIQDSNETSVDPQDAVAELFGDNRQLAASLREAHVVCEKYRDLATSSLLEVWIDEAEGRAWFLFELSRHRLTNS